MEESELAKPVQLYRELYYPDNSQKQSSLHEHLKLYTHVDIQLPQQYELFVTGDIHADVFRFIELLLRIGCIIPTPKSKSTE
jgi:hypothetical protein